MSKKILIVDDEPELVKALTIRIESVGYEVIQAFEYFLKNSCKILRNHINFGFYIPSTFSESSSITG